MCIRDRRPARRAPGARDERSVGGAPPPIVLQLQMRLRGGALALVNALRARYAAKGRALHAWAAATYAQRAAPGASHDDDDSPDGPLEPLLLRLAPSERAATGGGLAFASLWQP